MEQIALNMYLFQNYFFFFHMGMLYISFLSYSLLLFFIFTFTLHLFFWAALIYVLASCLLK